jgi:serine/threonine-protein kinase
VDRVGEVLLQTYRIDRLLGEGGMSQVYEAQHVRVPKKFAVKFLHGQLKTNSEALQRFRREAEVIASLEHPNVVGLIDYNIADDGSPFIVLELVHGQNLGTRLESGAVPLFEAFRIAVAVGSALNAAHEKRIIHRDLKPENILLGREDQVKVVDFGVAKLGGAPELTTANEILGTIAYMAPEQLTGLTIDGRVDQYALAAIVYEMLSGRMPFSPEGSVTEQAMRVLHAKPPPIEGVSSAIMAVLDRGMSKDADVRFPSVSQFIDALLQGAHEPAPGELAPLPGEATSISSPLDLAPGGPTTAPSMPTVTPSEPIPPTPTAPSAAPSLPKAAPKPPTSTPKAKPPTPSAVVAPSPGANAYEPTAALRSADPVPPPARPPAPLPLLSSQVTVEMSAVNPALLVNDTDPRGVNPMQMETAQLPPPVSERVTAPSMAAVSPDYTAEVGVPERRKLGPGETTLRPRWRLKIWMAAAAVVLLIGIAATAIALSR